MSGSRHTRWKGFNDDDLHEGKEVISNYAHVGDQLRSLSAATRSMRAMLRTGQIPNNFQHCLDNTGSNDGIEFECGRLRESASCLKCRYFSRAQVVDWAKQRSIFTGPAKFVTVNDADVKLGTLNEYDPLRLAAAISELVQDTQRAKVLGNFEVGLSNAEPMPDGPALKWIPHFHLVVEGPDSDKFISKLRRTFNAGPRSVAVSRKRGEDPYQAICYSFKSPYARRNWKPTPTGKNRAELHSFFDQYSCSDLMIMPSQFRVSPTHRIHISPLRDVTTWQLLASSPGNVFSGVELRTVPRASKQMLNQAAAIAVELGVEWMITSGSDLLSLLSEQVPADPLGRRLLKVRVRRFGLLDAIS